MALLIVVTGIAIGCSKESGKPENSQGTPGNSCEGINAKFTADVSLIIQTKCATGSGCHGAGSTNGPGELTSFNQIKNAASSIKNAVVSGRMPLGGSLSTTQVNQIRCWVDNGTLNN